MVLKVHHIRNSTRNSQKSPKKTNSSTSSYRFSVSEASSGNTSPSRSEIIDEELRDVHRFCLENDIDPNIIKKSSDVLWRRLKSVERRRRFKKIVIVTCLVLAIVFTLQQDSLYRLLSAYLRIAMIKVLPWFDWTIFYKSNCLLGNPYYHPVALPIHEEDCKMCEPVHSIERMSSVSHALVSERCLEGSTPIVVTDGIRNWPAQEQFNVNFLRDLYVSDEVLKRIPPCMFVSSEHLKAGSVKALLNRAAKHEITSYYAHWENCEKTAVRLLRQFFRRPYFLPPSVESANRNWFLISSAHTSDKYKPLDLAAPLMWLAQLKGENKIKMAPRMPCNESCDTLYTVLHEGEILIWTDLLWLVDYMPISSGSRLNIAVLFGGYFD